MYNFGTAQRGTTQGRSLRDFHFYQSSCAVPKLQCSWLSGPGLLNQLHNKGKMSLGAGVATQSQDPLTSLRMCPRVRTRVVLEPILLVRKRVLEHLTRIDVADRVLPARGTTIVGHSDVLLGKIGSDIVQDHIACCP